MKTNQSGFNLIELLIVIVVVALLATIAMPSYQSFIRNSRLANVRSELMQNSALLERYYAQKSTFIGFNKNDLIQNEYFDISFTPSSTTTASASTGEAADNTSNPSDAGFVLQAVPNANYAGTESCTVYVNDSGIFWATSSDATPCPGYEEPQQP